MTGQEYKALRDLDYLLTVGNLEDGERDILKEVLNLLDKVTDERDKYKAVSEVRQERIKLLKDQKEKLKWQVIQLKKKVETLNFIRGVGV